MVATSKPRARKAAAPAALPPPAPAGTNAPVLTDPKLVQLAADYAKAAPEKNRLEKLLKELKPVLLAAMGDAPLAYTGKLVLTRSEVAAIPETPGPKITRSMVARRCPRRRGAPPTPPWRCADG